MKKRSIKWGREEGNENLISLPSTENWAKGDNGIEAFGGRMCSSIMTRQGGGLWWTAAGQPLTAIGPQMSASAGHFAYPFGRHLPAVPSSPAFWLLLRHVSSRFFSAGSRWPQPSPTFMGCCCRGHIICRLIACPAFLWPWLLLP